MLFKLSEIQIFSQGGEEKEETGEKQNSTFLISTEKILKERWMTLSRAVNC